jgi:hypothetical protein
MDLLNPFYFLLRRMLDFWNFCCSQNVFSVFSSSSQWIIDMFFKCAMCSQCPSLCPIRFALWFALGSYIDGWINKYPRFIMGLLAQAENGDKQFRNIKISCSQWEGSACTHLPWFVSLSWGERIFFHFSFVPNIFSSSSQCVPKDCSQ